MTIHTHNRGVATIMAAVLIGFAAMAITAMVWRLNHEAAARKTELRTTQFRQLLTAGAAASPAVFSGPKTSLDLPLPDPLASRHASVAIHLLPAERDLERLVVVQATLDGASMSQTLRYVRGTQGWGLVEAKLD